MRNLWLFFLRYYAFFLFLALEAFAIVLMVNNNSYHSASYFNSANNISADIYTKISNAKNLKEAVYKAVEVAEGGDTILFSPAFASFGMFKNEYDRGEQFNKIVSGL